MVHDQVICLWCEKYLGFFTYDLCSGDWPLVCNRVTRPWSRKYIGFFIDSLCLGDQLVVWKISRIFHGWWTMMSWIFFNEMIYLPFLRWTIFWFFFGLSMLNFLLSVRALLVLEHFSVFICQSLARFLINGSIAGFRTLTSPNL